MNKLKRFVIISLKILLLIVLSGAALYALLVLPEKPSNNRNWNEDQKILPTVKLDGNKAVIRNIRNFSYASTTSFIPNYYDKTFDISSLKRAYYIVEPFSGFKGAAHTFLSFEFPNDEFVAVSVEIRKEKGEVFSGLKGLFRNYEIMYVVADERDVVKLRSNFRKDEVYVYPIKADREKVQQMFRDMLMRVNTLAEYPEFYNTLTNTCTTNIVDHVNAITKGRVPFSFSILFPENSDRLAYDLGLIDTTLSFEDVRVFYHINDRALRFADDPNFSRKIREPAP